MMLLLVWVMDKKVKARRMKHRTRRRLEMEQMMIVVEDDDLYHVNDEDATPASPSLARLLLFQPPPLRCSIPVRSISSCASVMNKTGFNPVWEEKLCITFDCVGDMMDLVFVGFVVRQEKDKDGEEPLAAACAISSHESCLRETMFIVLRWEFCNEVPFLCSRCFFLVF